MHFSRFELLLFSGLCLTTTCLLAQETRGQILGRITDSSGAVVVSVQVKAVNTATSVAITTRTNERYARFLL